MCVWCLAPSILENMLLLPPFWGGFQKKMPGEWWFVDGSSLLENDVFTGYLQRGCSQLVTSYGYTTFERSQIFFKAHQPSPQQNNNNNNSNNNNNNDDNNNNHNNNNNNNTTNEWLKTQPAMYHVTPWDMTHSMAFFSVSFPLLMNFHKLRWGADPGNHRFRLRFRRMWAIWRRLQRSRVLDMVSIGSLNQHSKGADKSQMPRRHIDILF